MIFFAFRRPDVQKENVHTYLYLKNITEETGELKRLIRCHRYEQSLLIPGQPSPVPKFSNVTLTKSADKFTPTLNLAASTDLKIPSAILYFYCTKAKCVQYMVTLSDAFIKSTRQYLEEGMLCDTFSLGFTKIKWEYHGYSTGWDLSTNQPLT
ncbi:MAG: type VI secretion system tube protein Hcp [Bacillota bacterium]|nr:type VI secretion system tube protein Hcp [Bacillota bacterium]MDW7682617.1 type VI secretion system tube protein Hcp [Bacillota bacterium]